MDEFIERLKNTLIARMHLWLLGYPLTIETIVGYIFLTGIVLLITFFTN